HFTPSGAVGDTGHRRAPPAITGRRRPPPAATGHRLLQSCGLSGPIPTTSQSSIGPPATPPALPRPRPPRQPRLTAARLTSPLLAPRLDSPRRPPAPHRSCRRIVPARAAAGRRLRGPQTRGGPRQTDPP